ncbi:MAG: immune inhibitor A [Chloroflexota bacterium]|nr:immune inhibitor A [Chloroflexota bacterium]
MSPLPSSVDADIPTNPPALTELPYPPDRDLFQLAYELLLPPNHPEVPVVVNDTPVSYEVGREDEFFLVDLDGLEKYQSRFELRHVSPNAYWYVEDGLRLGQDDIEDAATEFEEIIYPRVTGYFGTEWKPGVDNDPRLTILHGDIRGAGGYFSSTDEYPSAIRPHSNQREMIYINARYLRVATPFYYSVLAHELNHAVMWNFDPSEDTWVSEGLAELSVTVAGYPAESIPQYLRRPFVSLVHWPLDNSNIGAHYGGASLFMHYLYEHYGGADRTGLRQLLADTADNLAGIDNYLAAAGYDRDFHSVLQDWVAANFLDEDEGLLGYRDMEVEIQPTRRLSRAGKIEREMDQYGTHYIEMGSRLREETLQFTFEGPGHNSIIPVDVPEGGCWWSNSGDSITSTLTREIELTGGQEATLSFDAWYSIEEEWDYVYLQVSTDGGLRWDILETRHTSSANPIGVAFGPGYTGESDGWISDEVDLSAYAGQQVMVRFQYVTDDALNDTGMCLNDLSVTGNGVQLPEAGWDGEGFVLIDNLVRQEFIVQLIQKGETNRVVPMTLELNSADVWVGELALETYDGLDRTMVAITPTAPATRQKASYVLEISESTP